MVFGPIAKIAGGEGDWVDTSGGGAVRYANWLENLTPEIAGVELQKALEEGAKLVKQVDQGNALYGAWQKFNPFAKTAGRWSIRRRLRRILWAEVLAHAGRGAEARDNPAGDL